MIRPTIAYASLILKAIFVFILAANTARGQGGDPCPDCTPLRRAAVLHDYDAMKHLLGSGISPNELDELGVAPIEIATMNDDTAMMSLLMRHGANINITNSMDGSLVGEAARMDAPNAIEMLLDHGASANQLNKQGESPLHIAAYGGLLTCVKVLLDAGAHIDALDSDGSSPLHQAIDNGQFPVVILLLKRGANPDTFRNGKTPLIDAIYDKYGISNHQLQAMFDQHRWKDSTGQLREREYRKIISALINSGASLALTDPRGATPLHIAAFKCDSSLVAELMQHGASVSALNKNRHTPADLAEEAHCGDVLAILNRNQK